MANPDLGRLTEQVPAPRQLLLAWWELHGR
jgi:hypothetical protein